MRQRISTIFNTLKEDIQAVFERDPAAQNFVEVLTCYPGLHALWLHRIAHKLWSKNFKTLARMVSHFTREITGIEIHPGARIGKRLFIDHGMGVVIGETTEIGDDVLIYTGVVLGGTSLEKRKRHPTIGNRVTIGTGATLLGNIRVGDEVKIGSGSVVVKSVPPKCTAVGIPARIVEEERKAIIDLEHGKLPDPVAGILKELHAEQEKINEKLSKLEKEKSLPAYKAKSAAMKG